MITTVVFDLGNVLVGWDPYLALADRMTREEWEEFAVAADFAGLNAQADLGVPISDVVRRAAAQDPYHGEVVGQYFRRFGDSLTGPVPGVAEIVDDLRTAGLRLVGLTNWSAETFHLAPGSAPAIRGLEAVVVSGKEGLAKPDPRLFRRLVERHGLVPAETVFIDDNAENIRGAEAVGFNAIRFDDASRLRRDLRCAGVLPPF